LSVEQIELSSASEAKRNWVRIRRAERVELARKRQAARIFAIGEYPSSAAKKSNSYELDFFICADRHNII